MSNRTYSELITLKTFEERFAYLKLEGVVGKDTFGFDRYVNQDFYHSQMWRNLRDKIIVRDMGCEMGLEDYPIAGPVYIHHMNPIALNDIENKTEILLNPEFLICVSYQVHNAIHYGDPKQIPTQIVVERKPFDTCPWKA